jgi:hypothetical protein
MSIINAVEQVKDVAEQVAGTAVAKAWYQSRTVWGALVAIAATLLHGFGIDLGSDLQNQLADLAMTLAGAAGGLVAIYGRVKAQAPIRGK